MKIILQNILRDLKRFSLSLEKKSILIDKPWALIDSDLEIQKLIFKKNKELIMSKNGQVTMGSWDYLPEARSLLIHRGKDTILCNEEFICGAVIILKMDGTNNDFFVLANENMIPDLNPYKYLKNLRYQNFFIKTFELSSGKELEVINSLLEPVIGDRVTIDAEAVPDGVYKMKNLNKKLTIKNSRIKDIFYEVKYLTKNGIEIMVEQESKRRYKKGERAWVYGLKPSDGVYKIVGNRTIVIENGVIKKVK